MKLRIGALVIFLEFCSMTSLGGLPAQEPEAARNVAAAYSDSSADLQKQIVEILNAMKEKNSAMEAELINSLSMPEDSTWFTDVYGPGFGASLLASYTRTKPNLLREIKEVYEANLGYGWMTPKILRYDDPEKVNAPIDHFLNSMNKIVPLYQTAFQGDRPSVRIKAVGPGEGIRTVPLRVAAGDLNGYYVFVQGRFRFIPQDILMKLPDERPVRIRLDMNVMKSKLLSRVDPRYPEDVYKKHMKGKVVVRVQVDTSGKIQDAKVVEGEPILSQPVLEAVKQWQFLPTLLDGDPVEVELDVEMGFNLLTLKEFHP